MGSGIFVYLAFVVVFVRLRRDDEGVKKFTSKTPEDPRVVDACEGLHSVSHSIAGSLSRQYQKVAANAIPSTSCIRCRIQLEHNRVQCAALFKTSVQKPGRRRKCRTRTEGGKLTTVYSLERFLRLSTNERKTQKEQNKGGVAIKEGLTSRSCCVFSSPSLFMYSANSAMYSTVLSSTCTNWPKGVLYCIKFEASAGGKSGRNWNDGDEMSILKANKTATSSQCH